MDLKRDFHIDDVSVVNFINLSGEERELVRRWRNHDDIRKQMYSEHMISLEEHAGFIAGLSNDDKNFYWLVKDKKGEYSGVIYLNRTDFSNMNAYLGIYSNPDLKTQGTGSTLIDCLKKIAFEKWDLHTLKLEVIETNGRAIHFYEKSGFAVEGRLKEFVFKKGRWYDVMIMGIVNRTRNRNEIGR
jgi:UDP-4-amino-4,6-dideoxy-N-acetyl-beta-L-altrosamine N-acetyltransferase